MTKYCVPLIALLSLVGGHGYASPVYVDGVVATVGRDAILHSDIMQEIMPMVHSFTATAASQEELSRQVEELFRDTLEQAIEHHILHMEAQSMGVEVPEDEVEKRVAEMRSHYESQEAFQRALEDAGHTMREFRERMRRQMKAITVSITKRRQFEREAVVTESDMAQYYQDHLGEFSFPARYRLRRIFVQTPAATDARDAQREQLRQLRDELLAGGDFAEKAREISNGPEAEQGGLIGWVRPGDLVEPLDGVLSALAPGEISDVLETEYGLHLLLMESIESEGHLSYDEARGEIEPLLRKQRGDERYRQWMSTLRKRNNVRVLY